MTHTLIDKATLGVLVELAEKFLVNAVSPYSGTIPAAVATATELLKNPAIPQVVANISGGVLQGASSDYPVDVYTLDFEDAHECEPDELIEVEGSDARWGFCDPLIDPAFVMHVTGQLEDLDAEVS